MRGVGLRQAVVAASVSRRFWMTWKSHIVNAFSEWQLARRKCRRAEFVVYALPSWLGASAEVDREDSIRCRRSCSTAATSTVISLHGSIHVSTVSGGTEECAGPFSWDWEAGQ